jgi:hypothetical protein
VHAAMIGLWKTGRVWWIWKCGRERKFYRIPLPHKEVYAVSVWVPRWTSDSNLRLSWSNCRAGYSTANGRYSFISVGWCGMEAVGYLIWMIYRVFFYISNLLWWKYRGFLKNQTSTALFSCTCNIKRVYETLPLCQIISGPDL